MFKHALLGAAFASADLIFEVDGGGLITFSLGATAGIAACQDGPLVGQAWRSLVSADDQELLAALIRSVGPGERRGPLRVTLAAMTGQRHGRPATLSVFRLPDRKDNVLSCALALNPEGVTSDDPSGLTDGADFTHAAERLLKQAERTGAAVRVDLVELTGFTAAAGRLNDDDADGVRRRVAATLRANALGGEGASELSPDRFAVLRSASASRSKLDELIKGAVGDLAEPRSAELLLGGASLENNLRALRFALDRYIEAGPDAASAGFSAVVEETAARAEQLKSSLNDDTWRLLYQPVVSLADERVHHFEALTRFEAGVSPSESIHLAEELGLIVEFDLSVTRKVVEALAHARPEVEIAVNVSALSLMLPSFHKAFSDITAGDRTLRSRLLIEVTETQRISELPEANQAIQSLRRLGHRVCLDDFGAGAASLDYLRHLEVDFVKFDGRYIKALTPGSRDELVLKHMVNLCRDLGAETIAEMIEQPQTARLAQRLGVALGQGWCFGKPGTELSVPAKEQPSVGLRGRRAGARDTWG